MRKNSAGWVPKAFALALFAASLSLFSSPDQASAEAARAKSCTVPEQQAQLVGSPLFEAPTIAQEQGATGSVLVWIDLSEAGRLKDAAIARSSGNSMLDNEALRVARLSQYAPAQQDCQPVERAYLYEVSFSQES